MSAKLFFGILLTVLAILASVGVALLATKAWFTPEQGFCRY